MRLVWLVVLLLACDARAGQRTLLLATTTSTQDTGLLDVLVPAFETKTGIKVKTVAVGSGAALALGARGEADVLLVHAPDAEQEWMAAGHGDRRLAVMQSEFVIVGPAADPASVRAPAVARATLRIAMGTAGTDATIETADIAFVALTFTGHASLWSAIAADMGASLLVIFNGLRLLGGR